MVAAIAIGATVGSAVIGSASASAASDAQSESNAAALAQNEKQFDITQANQAPWLAAGGGALGKLSTLYDLAPAAAGSTNPAGGAYAANTGAGTGTFKNAAGGASTADPNASFYLSPDYNFNLNRGLKGLTAAGAAGSGTDNGAQRKAEISYAGDLATGQYQNYKNGLLSLAGLGQATSGQAAAAGQANANANSAILTNQGSSLASSYLGQGKIASDALTGLGGIAQRYLGGDSLPSVSALTSSPATYQGTVASPTTFPSVGF